MKQFNLQEYLAHPERKVVTRDGMPVRIICTDSGVIGGQIVAIVTNANKSKDILQFNENGSYYSYSDSESEYDLFFAPTKHVDYINLYRNEFGYFLGDNEYKTAEVAKKVAAGDKEYITTVKVEWEDE